MSAPAGWRPTGAFVVLLVLGASACGRADEEPVFWHARDSAGVEIVEVRWDDSPVDRTVGPQPEWEVGRAGGLVELELYDVRDLTVLGDGRLVIAEASSQQIISIDPAARTVERWGGQGSGPGEFRGLERVFDMGDGRIAAYDASRRRILHFDGGGSFTGSTAVPLPQGMRPMVVRAGSGAGGGDFYVGEVSDFGPADGIHRGYGPVVRVADPPDTISLIRGMETFRSARAAGGVMFGRETLLAGGAEGLWIGDTAKQEVTLWRTSAGPERIVRWSSRQSRAVTREREEEFWEWFVTAMPEFAPILPEARATLVFADTLPAFGSLAVGPRGQLWIGSYLPQQLPMVELPTPPQEWLVLDFDARTAWRIVLPDAFLLRFVGDGYVVGVHRDDLGVESIRRYYLN